MNLLIVDDEVYSVAGIASSLPWEKLGIQQVFQAYSMAQAQEVFAQHTIDLMICDIEMPMGTGLELMAWVRNQGFPTVCIFLTCYSKFEYTSRAIQLQIFDYILKPAEYDLLEETVSRGVEEVQRLRQTLVERQQSEFWNQEQQHLNVKFWASLLKGEIPGDLDKIRTALSQRHLDQDMAEHSYYLLLIQTLPDKNAEQWEEHMLHYAFSNILNELLHLVVLPQLPHRRFLAVVHADAYENQEAFAAQCERSLHTLSSTLPAAFLAYYDTPCTMDQVSKVAAGLAEDAKNNLSMESMVFFHQNAYTQGDLPEIPEDRWKVALLGHNADIINEDIDALLRPKGRNRIVGRNVLKLIYHHLLNTVYSVLETYHLPAYQPFLQEDAEGFEHALDSVLDFQVWVQALLEHTVDLVVSEQASSSLVETIRKYIRQHMEEPLSRTVLANVVHLHPDYLSFLFRDKSGYSLSEFITMERIRCAKQLLLTTDLPVHEIAIRTGFQNISYFSKQFKRMEHQTPLHYRKQGAGG